MITPVSLRTLGAEHPKPHLYLPVHERIARKLRRNLVPAPPQPKVQTTTSISEKRP